jgi:VCBS repeat-containing protein
MNMNIRSKNRHFNNDKLSKRKAMLRGLEPLESRHLMAGEILQIHLDAVDLDGTTAITQVQEGQEFLLRGLVRDINPDTVVAPTNGAFRVYTDIGYSSSEVQPMVSEVQMLGFTGDPAGGTFTLTYNGATTAPINYHQSQDAAQAKDIQDALNALPGLTGNVKVDMDLSTNINLPTDRYFIRFMNGLANTNVNPITADASNLLSDPLGDAAGIEIQTRGEGMRSDTEAFKQAFAYNAQTNGHNIPLDAYPELRQGADQPDLFDNVGGGAPLSAIGRQTFTYFLVRLKATSGGADGQLVFTNALANQQGLETLMFGLDDPLTPAQVKFSYGDTTPTDGLQITVLPSGITAAPDNTYTVLEDSAAAPLSPSPLANDTQTGSGTLTITGVSTGSAGGTLTLLNGGANVSYKPAANFFGTETFTYTVSNGQASTTGTISITVTNVNDAPSFTKGSNITVDEDAGPQTIANWATAISAGPNETAQTVSFTLTTNNNALFETPPAIAADGTLTFKTAANANGQATVTVYLKDSGTKANGGENQSGSQTFTITVRGVNDAPVHTVPGARTTSGATPILFQGATQIKVFDVDSDTSNITTTLAVTHGQLQLGGTIAAGLVVTGNNSNLLTLTGTHVQITQALSLLTYTPLSGYIGSDVLQVVTNDNGNTGSGGAKSVTSTVDITVQAGAVPEAVNDSASMDEDGSPLTIDVLLNDGVHPTTKGIIQSVQQPALVDGKVVGTVAIDDNGTSADPTDDKLVFTPAADFNGQVSFTYVMNDTDGSGNDSTGLVTVTVNAVNDAPTSAPNYAIFDEDTTLVVPTSQSVLNNDGDVDGDTLTAVLVSGPKKGTLTFNTDGSFTYVPDPDVYGQDVFKYQAQDPSGALSPARTVTLFITATPDKPVATEKTYTLREDTTLWVAADKGLLVGATDADGDLTFKARRVTGAAHGTVSVMPDGRFSYAPAANFYGTDSFTYQVVDSTGRLSDPQTVTLNVTAVNDRPNSVGEQYTTRAGAWLVVPASAGVLANDTDADGNALRAMRASLPTHGKAWVNADGSFSYSPNAGFVGTDSFEYWAIDDANVANSFSPRTTVTITVASVNQAPVVVAQTYNATEDTDLVVNAANGLLKGTSDPEGNPVFVKVVSQPSKGQLDWSADGSFIYKPNANAFGTETLTFQVSDGQANSPLRTVTINIAGVNDPPPVVDDSFDVVAGLSSQSLGDLLTNDRNAPNPDGAETLSLVSFQATTAQGGKVQRNANGEFLYTPKAGFLGTDTFTYVVGDGKGGQSTAQITLTVKAPPSTLVSGFVYRDTNNNGRRDAGEIGIGNVEVQLTSSANPTKVFRAVTDGSGRYQFTNVGAGTFTITEHQPEYLTDGKESLGSAGGTVGGDSFTFTVPKFGLPNDQAINYNFGEGVLILGQTTNGNPPLQLSLEELAASSSNQGALLALNGSSQSWFTTLDPSWANVRSMAVQVAPNSSSLTLTLVVNQNGLNLTYQGVVGRTSSAAMDLRFRVMATNNQGFQILRLDGVLDLSDFTLVNSSAAGADAVLANW